VMAGRTTLIVSHRVSAVCSADEILVLDRGRIAERGTHDELVARGGIYARMVGVQTGSVLGVGCSVLGSDGWVPAGPNTEHRIPERRNA
jgi:energy-coupling factor transporter ATP-binding protein EcfA2